MTASVDPHHLSLLTAVLLLFGCRGDRYPLVQLNVLTEDIDHAFRNDPLWDKLRNS